MKICFTCKEALPVNSFSKRSKNKDGLSNICKQCIKDVNRRSYVTHSADTSRRTPREVPYPKSFAALFPEILKCWDKATNDVDPSKISSRNTVKVQWFCPDCSYRWSSTLNSITRKGDRNPCPHCAKSRGVGVLTTAPEITSWCQADLTQVSRNSNRKFSFVCPENKHHFVSSMKDFDFSCKECKTHKRSVAVVAPHLVEEWADSNNLNPETVTYSSSRKVSWVCAEGHEWEAFIYQRVLGKTGCPVCSAKTFSSAAENTLAVWLSDLVDVQRNTRNVVVGSELDIYIPEKKIAVEFNGLHWHSEFSGKPRSYHYDKWLKAKQMGVQLIQVWEDDWNRNPELVKRMLAHKLGLSGERKVYARKTKESSLSKREAEMFLETNHIQGYASGSLYLGLKDVGTEELVAVLVLKNESGDGSKTLNIIRYATSVNVVGGFTKLLTYAERTYKPEKFITFADHCVSDGKLYENNGFVADKELPPDYMYVVKKTRQHKFGYRLKKFKNDPNLKYEEGLTERELALLNNLPRIWDAGKTRYTKQVVA